MEPNRESVLLGSPGHPTFPCVSGVRIAVLKYAALERLPSKILGRMTRIFCLQVPFAPRVGVHTLSLASVLFMHRYSLGCGQVPGELLHFEIFFRALCSNFCLAFQTFSLPPPDSRRNICLFVTDEFHICARGCLKLA